MDQGEFDANTSKCFVNSIFFYLWAKLVDVKKNLYVRKWALRNKSLPGGAVSSI